ncbi:helix-turn-helix domain-containing protein [Trinickia acidisoli]|uniref:helix-turn-helix domain-containing protein n=1 Tax=Trinickia acidisoli TaxID=2767482 RepID=UPI001A8F51D1|nr:helix-turn-helix transcriptional regulator [Trinickia acidisoli]
MAAIQISPDALRRARRAVGVTQAKLAEDTGVNVTLIKHFETFRINALPLSAQDALVEYFKEKGVDISAEESSKSTNDKPAISPVPRGAFPVPPGTVAPRMSFTISEKLTDQEVESALARMDENDEEISDLMRKVTSKGLWGGYTDETVLDSQRLFGLMAENYMLFRYMQGTNFLADLDHDAKDETHAHIVQRKASDSGSPLVAQVSLDGADEKVNAKAAAGSKAQTKGQASQQGA